MSSYVARPHVLTDEFVPGYLGDSFGLFPFVHGDSLANQFDGPFLVRLIRKEVTHISGFLFGIESRDRTFHPAGIPALCAAVVAGQYPATIKLTHYPPTTLLPQTSRNAFNVRRCSVMAE